MEITENFGIDICAGFGVIDLLKRGQKMMI